MTPAQARALLELLADLYQLASTPEPPPPEPVANGTPQKPVRVKT
jgi:hypothetical protein